jgi:hypothetical protein
MQSVHPIIPLNTKKLKEIINLFDYLQFPSLMSYMELPHFYQPSLALDYLNELMSMRETYSISNSRLIKSRLDAALKFFRLMAAKHDIEVRLINDNFSHNRRRYIYRPIIIKSKEFHEAKETKRHIIITHVDGCPVKNGIALLTNYIGYIEEKGSIATVLYHFREQFYKIPAYLHLPDSKDFIKISFLEYREQSLQAYTAAEIPIFFIKETITE